MPLPFPQPTPSLKLFCDEEKPLSAKDYLSAQDYHELLQALVELMTTCVSTTNSLKRKKDDKDD